MMKKRYRALYDKDAREEVKSETAGYYGKMISFAMLSKRDYVAEMFDKATSGWGCDETILVELFVMCEQSWLQEGKAAWEGKSDKSLIDYLNKELGTSYASLGKQARKCGGGSGGGSGGGGGGGGESGGGGSGGGGHAGLRGYHARGICSYNRYSVMLENRLVRR